MGSAVFSSHCPPNLPRPTITRGRIASICALEERLAGEDLVRLGVAVLGRPALDDVRDEDVRRFILMPFSMMSVSSCPARPTNARPCSSSSAPGASPTNISSARGLPWPKTIVLRPAGEPAARQSPMSSRIAASAAAGSAGPARGSRRRARPRPAAPLPAPPERRPGHADRGAADAQEARRGPRRSREHVRPGRSPTVGGARLPGAHARAPRAARAPRPGCARPARASSASGTSTARCRRGAAGRPRSSRRRSRAPGAVTSFATIRSRFFAASFFARVRERGPRSPPRSRRGRARPSPRRGPSGCRACARARASTGPSVFLSFDGARRAGR